MVGLFALSSDVTKYILSGGCIELYLKKTLSFDLNVKASKRAGRRVSSRVLDLAVPRE